MADNTTLIEWHPEHHARDRQTAIDVVFVHGLMGDAVKTWQRDDASAWPQWLANDLPELRVWSAQYPAAPAAWFKSSASAQPGIEGLAAQLANALDAKGVGVGKPCVFVCHSMGGLVVNRLLVSAAQGGNAFRHQQARGVVYLATPHRGADFADWISSLREIKDAIANKGLDAARGLIAGWFPEWIKLEAGAVTGQVTQLVEDLKANNPSLLQLNSQFLTYYQERQKHARACDPHASLNIRILYETLAEWRIAPVVKAESADPYLFEDLSSKPLVPIPVKETHTGLCKLKQPEGEAWDAVRGVLFTLRAELDPFSSVGSVSAVGAVTDLRWRIYRQMWPHARLKDIWRQKYPKLAAGDREAVAQVAAEFCREATPKDLCEGILEVLKLLDQHRKNTSLLPAEQQMYDSVVGELARGYGRCHPLPVSDRPTSFHAHSPDDSEMRMAALEVAHAMHRGSQARFKLQGEGISAEAEPFVGSALCDSTDIPTVGRKLLRQVAEEVQLLKEPGRRRTGLSDERTQQRALMLLGSLARDGRAVTVDARDEAAALLRSPEFHAFLASMGVERGLAIGEPSPDPACVSADWFPLVEALSEYYYHAYAGLDGNSSRGRPS